MGGGRAHAQPRALARLVRLGLGLGLVFALTLSPTRTRTLRRALHGWRQKTTTLAAAGRLLTSAALLWSASGRGGAFAHWRARARARSVAWRGAVRPTRSRLQP